MSPLEYSAVEELSGLQQVNRASQRADERLKASAEKVRRRKFNLVVGAIAAICGTVLLFGMSYAVMGAGRITGTSPNFTVEVFSMKPVRNLTEKVSTISGEDDNNTLLIMLYTEEN
ncbi:hypothetical protein IscW_ISCW007605 [Ixodes scapularis]|uniref:Uncharacterized protein n=1 Tax=Ixodes scapularis TaxID=6945 RepID=B7PU07_IXOSC|nr:hypothetical protein IscW_ISCW007605 [Ixodes scapularis]|eukprot:XP_002405215.1 hypothetical protein IscW_ISCW007605 [Ixodes scapularis]